MNREWPSVLKPYVGPTANAVSFRPERWASGQLTILIGCCVCVAAGVVGVIVESDHRIGGLFFTVVFAIGALIAARDRAKWVRVETSDSGIDVTSGVWRRTLERQRIANADVQTVRVQQDEKTYGYKIPIRRHVIIEHVSVPFAGAPTGIRIGEMYGLQTPVLEALRDELAARAGKSALPSAS